MDESLPVSDRGNEDIDRWGSAANWQDRSEERRFLTSGGNGSDVPPFDTNGGGDSKDPLCAMHTAEHVLSAVMRRDYGSPQPLETHLGAKKSKCDYRVDRPLSEDDLHGIEAAVNAEIAADHPVADRLLPADEARNRFDLSKIPDGSEMIRIVAIEDLDSTPCPGGHVQRTSQIGRFEIRSTEMRTESRIRIRFRLLDRVKGVA